MNDYWNNPPDSPEPPEWYMTLEDVLEQMDPPQTVADVIRTAMEAWVDEHNKSQDYDPNMDPPDDPKDIEGDYLRDEMIDRQMEEAREEKP